jgi:hypothetical protein
VVTVVKGLNQVFGGDGGNGFYQQSGVAAIGAGADGSVWVAGADGALYMSNGSGWTNGPGTGIALSVDPRGKPWWVDASGDIFHAG